MLCAVVVLAVALAGCGSSGTSRATTGSTDPAGQTTASTPARPTTSTPSKPPAPARHQRVAAARARADHSLPLGCNLDIEGQTIGALAGHDDAFHFDGYNAVPPGHRVSDVVVIWGDGTMTSGTAVTLPKPFAAGCFETVFTGHHTYTHVVCKKGACSADYKVTVRYRDARTGKRHTLTKLSVEALRPEKPHPGQPQVPPSGSG